MTNVTAKECVTRSNKLLYHSTSSEKFVTLFYGILDTERHQLSFSNAGHDHPIVYSSDKKIHRLKTGGIVLGIMENYPFEQESIALQHGDILVVYSDGVAEAMNAEQEQFGEERLIGVIKKNRRRNAQEIIEHILSAVKLHTGDYPQYDDMTLLVVQRNEK